MVLSQKWSKNVLLKSLDFHRNLSKKLSISTLFSIMRDIAYLDNIYRYDISQNTILKMSNKKAHILQKKLTKLNFR